MTSALNDRSLDQIVRSARTPNGWTDRPVEEDTVREFYDLMKWGGQHLRTAAPRRVGLDCGPMSGFDNAGVDKAFFSDGDQPWIAPSHAARSSNAQPLRRS
jgi:nitroreductase